MGSERNLIQGKENKLQSSLESQKREIKLFSIAAYCVWCSHPIYTLIWKINLYKALLAGVPFIDNKWWDSAGSVTQVFVSPCLWSASRLRTEGEIKLGEGHSHLSQKHFGQDPQLTLLGIQVHLNSHTSCHCHHEWPTGGDVSTHWSQTLWILPFMWSFKLLIPMCYS